MEVPDASDYTKLTKPGRASLATGQGRYIFLTSYTLDTGGYFTLSIKTTTSLLNISTIMLSCSASVIQKFVFQIRETDGTLKTVMTLHFDISKVIALPELGSPTLSPGETAIFIVSNEDIVTRDLYLAVLGTTEKVE